MHWYGDEAEAKVKAAAKDALGQAGAYMVGAARAEIVAQDLIDTGNLLNSMADEEAGELAQRVGTNVHYAIYLEYGTVRMSAKAFMRRAIEDGTNQANIVKIAMAALGSVG